MGEIADYYIDRMLDRHMNNGKVSPRKRRNPIESFIKNLSDKELRLAAESSIRDAFYNDKFLEVAQKVLALNPSSLTEKQRNCFYGLIVQSELEIRKSERQANLEMMSDAELIALSQEAVAKELHNEKFHSVANKILEKNPKKLFEKERNCLYGLVANFFILK